MKIRSVKAWLMQLPLVKPYTIAYKTIDDTEIVFFEIELANGITGLGASNPFEEVVGETPAATLVNLQQDFVQQLVGCDIEDFNLLIDNATLYFPNMPGTVAAIDLALHDAYCQWKSIPVIDLLGRKLDALPTSVTIGIKETAAMLEEARSYCSLGFKAIKVKTGIDVEQDIEIVCKLYETIGSQSRIRVDANQGYTLKQLQQFLHLTKHIPLELIEQPLPAGEEKELCALDKNIRSLLCADESLTGIPSAKFLAEHPQPFGIFNIKLMKCGGIKAAREMAAIALYSSIDLFWGCNDESMASIAAALQVAYSCSNTKYLDLDGSFDLSEDIVTGGFILKDGLLYCSDQPGLGLKKE